MQGTTLTPATIPLKGWGWDFTVRNHAKTIRRSITESLIYRKKPFHWCRLWRLERPPKLRAEHHFITPQSPTRYWRLADLTVHTRCRLGRLGRPLGFRAVQLPNPHRTKGDIVILEADMETVGEVVVSNSSPGLACPDGSNSLLRLGPATNFHIMHTYYVDRYSGHWELYCSMSFQFDSTNQFQMDWQLIHKSTLWISRFRFDVEINLHLMKVYIGSRARYVGDPDKRHSIC